MALMLMMLIVMIMMLMVGGHGWRVMVLRSYESIIHGSVLLLWCRFIQAWSGTR